MGAQTKASVISRPGSLGQLLRWTTTGSDAPLISGRTPHPSVLAQLTRGPLQAPGMLLSIGADPSEGRASGKPRWRPRRAEGPRLLWGRLHVGAAAAGACWHCWRGAYTSLARQRQRGLRGSRLPGQHSPSRPRAAWLAAAGRSWAPRLPLAAQLLQALGARLSAAKWAGWTPTGPYRHNWVSAALPLSCMPVAAPPAPA